jgi:hypothetical protein
MNPGALSNVDWWMSEPERQRGGLGCLSLALGLGRSRRPEGPILSAQAEGLGCIGRAGNRP